MILNIIPIILVYHTLTSATLSPKPIFPDVAVDFTVPLSDQTAPTYEDVTFTCEMTRPGAQVSWYKDGEEITMGEKYEIVSDGVTQHLTIHECVPGDVAEYTIKCGTKTSSAKLALDGMNMI